MATISKHSWIAMGGAGRTQIDSPKTMVVFCPLVVNKSAINIPTTLPCIDYNANYVSNYINYFINYLKTSE